MGIFRFEKKRKVQHYLILITAKLVKCIAIVGVGGFETNPHPDAAQRCAWILARGTQSYASCILATFFTSVRKSVTEYRTRVTAI